MAAPLRSKPVARASAIVDALFGTTPGASAEPKGPVNLAEVDRRMARVQADLRGPGRPIIDPEDPHDRRWFGAAGAWMGRVAPLGVWDDQGRARVAGDPTYRRKEHQGNFSYGATAATLGLPEGVALWGAGAAQRLSNVRLAAKGLPLKPSQGHFAGAYGDDPNDQASIREGYRYGQRRLLGR